MARQAASITAGRLLKRICCHHTETHNSLESSHPPGVSHQPHSASFKVLTPLTRRDLPMSSENVEYMLPKKYFPSTQTSFSMVARHHSPCARLQILHGFGPPRFLPDVIHGTELERRPVPVVCRETPSHRPHAVTTRHSQQGRDATFETTASAVAKAYTIRLSEGKAGSPPPAGSMSTHGLSATFQNDPWAGQGVDRSTPCASFNASTLEKTNSTKKKTE